VSGRRTAHGRAAELGAVLVYEATASDELRPLPSVLSEPIERKPLGQFTSDGAKAAVRRRQELCRRPDYVQRELEFVAWPDFEPFEVARRALTSEAGEELAKATGGLSRRVWTIVRGACWLTSLAEYWAVQAAKTGSGEASDRAARLFQKASIENVKALDLATLEATARKNAHTDAVPPWLSNSVRSDAPSNGAERAAVQTTCATSEIESAPEGLPGASTGQVDPEREP